ncbi:hypothetical protein C3E79_07485 [Corynebacterium liangguodongii]|uniref:Low molecular weight antigen MTB12-like C-terminal domain-containing protein n=1 Tax=Corynebacterium liangguodongii TaxID=2079535 RepID=A0A2S0WHE6_9CORY|nr:hypothetical protein C3E79_07485 [Corynebacterium liangguodongii]PWB99956.1 hypothetical protein DF219_04080 [Corynebacterium liangguodongii]
MALGATMGVAACSNEAETTPSETSTVASSAEAAPAAELPSAADLNGVLARATDPAVPMEERVNTVQGGETAPELFDVMAQSQQQSGANFHVVDPVLPGYEPNSVLATVSFNQPEQGAQLADNVEFVFENGYWKLSKTWACTLVTHALPPEQVPPMCQSAAPAEGGAPAPAPAEGGAPAPAPAL